MVQDVHLSPGGLSSFVGHNRTRKLHKGRDKWKVRAAAMGVTVVAMKYEITVILEQCLSNKYKLQTQTDFHTQLES